MTPFQSIHSNRARAVELIIFQSSKLDFRREKPWISVLEI